MTLKARIENGIVYSPYPSEPVPEMTFYQVVKHSLEQYGCRTALVWNDEEITFAELLKMCQQYAAGFQRHGVKKGEKVLVHLDNSLENMIALYSVVFAGGVFVASHLILSDDDILYRIRDSNAAHILTTTSEAKRFSNLRNKMDVKGYFSVGTAPGFVSVSDFKKLNEDTFQEFPVADVKKEVIVLLYTSGTTGSPKAVEHTHYSIVAHLPRPGSHQVSSDQEVVASCLPISSTITFRFYLEDTTSGAKTVLLSKSMGTDKMVDAMRKYQVTKVFGSPHWILQLAKAIEKRGNELDSLTTILLCGAKATPHILRQIERSFDLAIVKETYGASEVARVCRPPWGASRWYGIGFPSPMVQVKVVDVKSGKVLGPNEEGELLVKTPCSMKGYYGRPEATSQKITPDGWVRTGDICYYNEDGQFFYVERMSEYFKCMSIHVAPCSIESVLLSHDGIEEAAVIGVPHPQYYEAALAFVVLKKSCSKITEEELQNFVAGQLGPYMHLHGGVKFVDKIPKNANGKVMRRKLEMLHQDG
ncbi:4-coumarate--CoA ligase 1-like [Ixodes scapularis]|uniref:4-coumarate--CoA ligase 1-like n=1 Tax=Ixodes scapularis TaxID=6945 RepID=UPI001A9FBF2F|nr:4-coumarate--CoA ligase 1-like [Ixodes scapularis]